MIWCLRSYEIDALWLFFESSTLARQALELYSQSIPVSAAVESELEPLAKLERFDASQHVIARKNGLQQYNNNAVPSHVKPSNSLSPADAMSSLDNSPGGFDCDFTLSSNPPNPKSNIRSGDWICSSSACNAHNFGRNLSCIGCGTSRTATSSIPVSLSLLPNQHYAQPPSGLSPRFLSPPSSCSSVASSPRRHEHPPVSAPQTTASSPPLLTPSGRGFARGGFVRNVSEDPLVPCIMYWPDNEALPERGQIRPSAYTGSPHPPILNTGNRGPISHQPGDWICLKCNYLNWRRRKVCQTCFPYAEGNGDSISAAVQTERIALLTNVLQKHATESPVGFIPSPLASPFTSETSSLTSSPTTSMFSGDHRPPRMLSGVQHQQLRSQSMTPPLALNDRYAPSAGRTRLGASAGRRAQSHYNLHAQYSASRHSSDTIYQTSANAPVVDSSCRPRVSASAQSSPTARRRALGSPFLQETFHAPRPLLPSFLHEIADEPQEQDISLPSPLLSLANLSLDEMQHSSVAARPRSNRQTSGSSSTSSPMSNALELERIWSENTEFGSTANMGSRLLGGEPTKALWSTGFGTIAHVGEQRRSPPTVGVIGPPGRSVRTNHF